MAADLERQKLVFFTHFSGMVMEELWLPTPDFFNETCGGKLKVSVQRKTRENTKNCNPTAHLFDEKTKKIALYFLQQKILYFT